MSKEIKPYTITVFSENNVGILNLISIVYTRRFINIESISASTTSIPGIYKTTVVSYSDRETMEKVRTQIEKAIYVLKAFLYTDDEILYQEVALYKVPTKNMLEKANLEHIIRKHNARIMDITPDFIVIEKTGHYDETESLFYELKTYDIKQFVRSGRVCVTKDPVEHLDAYLEKREQDMQKLKTYKNLLK